MLKNKIIIKMLLFKEKFKRTQVYNKNIEYKHSKKLKRKKKD